VVDFHNLKLDIWQQTLNVNVTGSMLCSRALFNHAQKAKKGGAIVNISSLGGIRSTQKFKGLLPYVTSKFAVVGLTEALAVEGKELGIRVNCVAPGAVDTDMLKKAAPFLKTSTYPEDVAKTILFLCDAEQSGKISGSTLEIHSNE
jgi:3-oxoacyl-[acyl-carrier protein] reductase